jgi:hypothetical protein
VTKKIGAESLADLMRICLIAGVIPLDGDTRTTVRSDRALDKSSHRIAPVPQGAAATRALS